MATLAEMLELDSMSQVPDLKTPMQWQTTRNTSAFTSR